MSLSSFSKFTFLGLLVLVACATQAPPISTPISLPPTPTPDLGLITPENVNRLFEIKQLGMGEALGTPLYSPDGKWLFQATTSGVFVFDTTSYTNRLLTPYSTLAFEDRIIDLSPDGKTLVMGNDLVMAESGQKISNLDVPWPGTWAAIFSPDGMLLARGYNIDRTSNKSRIGIWRVADGSLLQTFDVESLGPLGFSTDGRLISIQTGYNGTPFFIIYDTQSGKKLSNWTGQQAVFLPENKLAVETDGTIRIYDLATGIAEHAFFGELVGTSSDGKVIALLSFDQFKVYRISDEGLLLTIEAHPTRNFGAILRFSSDGQTLAVYTADYCCGGHTDTLSLWRMDGTLIKKIDKPSNLFNFSPDGKSLVVTISSRSTQIINVADGSLKANVGTYNLMAIGVTFLPDGRRLVVAGVESMTEQPSGYGYQPPLFFYDLESGELYKTQPSTTKNEPHTPSTDGKIYTPDEYFGGRNCRIVISPDGRFNASGGFEGIVIRNAPDGSMRFSIDEPVYDCQSPLEYGIGNQRLTFSPDSRILAIGLIDGTIELWDTEKSERIYSIKTTNNPSNIIYDINFSPDGRLLAAGFEDGSVKIYGIK